MEYAAGTRCYPESTGRIAGNLKHCRCLLFFKVVVPRRAIPHGHAPSPRASPNGGTRFFILLLPGGLIWIDDRDGDPLQVVNCGRKIGCRIDLDDTIPLHNCPEVAVSCAHHILERHFFAAGQPLPLLAFPPIEPLVGAISIFSNRP